MNRTIEQRQQYRNTEEFKDAYRSYKIRNRISDNDDSQIDLFGCFYSLKKLKDLNPYNKYRYNNNDDNKIEVG